VLACRQQSERPDANRDNCRERAQSRVAHDSDVAVADLLGDQLALAETLRQRRQSSRVVAVERADHSLRGRMRAMRPICERSGRNRQPADERAPVDWNEREGRSDRHECQAGSEPQPG
jgi:hypothetical protein